MKRSLLLGIVGFVAAVSTSYGQGGIVIGNYRAPFNRAVWGGPGFLPGTPVLSTQGVNLSVWFGEGVLTADQLVLNVPVNWNIQSEASGYAGYYGPTTVSLPTWSPGETWTFQIRASGNSVFGPVDTILSRSVPWTEQGNISDVGGIPPGPPGVSQNSIGLTVYITPEPSAFALVGLGLSGWMFVRRRTA